MSELKLPPSAPPAKLDAPRAGAAPPDAPAANPAAPPAAANPMAGPRRIGNSSLALPAGLVPNRPLVAAAAQPEAPDGYTAQPGDSLGSVAADQLGDQGLWPSLFALNKPDNPFALAPGQDVQLPQGDATDPAAPFDFDTPPETIAQALGAPLENVQQFWPAFADALKENGITTNAGVIAALATVGTESGKFEPIEEKSSGEQYEGREKLGNTEPGDGPRFKGRGLIQITGRKNYTEYGEKLGLDLVNHPEQALEPAVSARIAARYLADHGVPRMAEDGNWEGARWAVNGGLNGFGPFARNVGKLQLALAFQDEA